MDLEMLGMASVRGGLVEKVRVRHDSDHDRAQLA